MVVRRRDEGNEDEEIAEAVKVAKGKYMTVRNVEKTESYWSRKASSIEVKIC